MQAKLGKRTLSLILALVMSLSLLPMAVSAGYDGVFDIYVFDNNAGDNNETVTALTLDSSGTARFGISLDLSVTFPDDIVYIKMFDSESDTWYTLYESGVLYYGASADEFATGFLSVVTIPNMTEGTYMLEAAVKGEEGYDRFYISNPEMAIAVGSGGSGTVTPTISTSVLPSGRVGEPYAFTLTGSNVATASRDLSLTIAEVQTCTVSFALNGGTGVAGEQYTGISVPVGHTLVWPAAPTRTGFTFLGWSCGGIFYPVGSDGPVVYGGMRFTG